jgi:hypothetical protein
MYIEGEVPYISGGNGNGGMWGQDGIWAILLLALLGNGFGNRGGYGYGGGAGFVGGDVLGYELGKVATQADIAAGFNNSATLGGINDLKLANAQGFAGLNSAIANTTSTLGYNMLQGFHGVDNAVCTLGYNMASGFNTIGHQISDCCCSTKAAIADLKYANEAQTCQLLTNQNAQTQRNIDYLTNEKIESLRAENVALKGRISNDAQSAYILDRLSPCPRPAYVVPNPNCCYSACGGNTISGVL